MKNGEQLAAIRRAILAVMHAPGQPEAGADLSTADLVKAFIQVALVTHEAGQGALRELRAVGQVLAEAGAPAGLSPSEQVKAVVQAHGPVRETYVPADEALAILSKAAAEGKLTLTAGAMAGISEALTGESGAVEVALTIHELTDLIKSGVAFTEVGSGEEGGPDVLVKLVDTTGKLRALATAWAAVSEGQDVGTSGAKPSGEVTH